MKHIFFSILTALAFWQCSPPAPAPKNILNCYVRFDAAAKKIKAEASLQDGASRRSMEMPGGLRFQSVDMKILPVKGLTYMAEYPAAYRPELAYKWQNKKGEPGEFSLTMPSIDSFYFDTPVLSTKNTSNLMWIGTPLSKGETLVFIWENSAEGKTIPMEVSTTLGAPMIELPAAKIAQLGPGNWTVYLVRKHPETKEIAEFMVESRSEYYTKPLKVKVTDK